MKQHPPPPPTSLPHLLIYISETGLEKGEGGMTSTVMYTPLCLSRPLPFPLAANAIHGQPLTFIQE